MTNPHALAEFFRALARLLDGGAGAGALGGLLGSLGQPVPAPHGQPVDPQTLAVLTAAAVAALGRNVRIKKVRLLYGCTPSAWAVQGRMGIHMSHNVRSEV